MSRDLELKTASIDEELVWCVYIGSENTQSKLWTDRILFMSSNLKCKINVGRL